VTILCFFNFHNYEASFAELLVNVSIIIHSNSQFVNRKSKDISEIIVRIHAGGGTISSDSVR